MKQSLVVCLVTISCLALVCAFVLVVTSKASALPPEIVSVSPTENSNTAATDSDVTAAYDQAIDPASVSDATIVVDSARAGRLLDPPNITGVTGGGDDAVYLEPAFSLFPGDLIRTTVTTGIQNSIGESAATSFTWEFRTAVAPGTGLFGGTGRMLGDANSNGVALGDLDSDGDLDAFVVNVAAPNDVWLNDGTGIFTDSGQNLGANTLMFSVAMGDLDADGDLDAFVPVFSEPNEVWLNDGAGAFTDSGQRLGEGESTDVALGDADGDGDLDAFVANSASTVLNERSNKVWLNDGTGMFTDSGQALGDGDSYGIAVGDVDGDGDLDAFVANYCPYLLYISRTRNRVWLNDGAGTFSSSGQILGSELSFDVALGDLDGDGDLDAFVTNEGASDEVWTNDGSGDFTDSGQSLGGPNSIHIALGDAEGDGTMDVFLTDYDEGSRILLNDGAGSFTDSGQLLGGADSVHPVLGDLDGDGDLDLFVGYDSGSNAVYLQTNCAGDTDYDFDVDGSDLATLCDDPGLLHLAVFADEFGGEGC